MVASTRAAPQERGITARVTSPESRGVPPDRRRNDAPKEPHEKVHPTGEGCGAPVTAAVAPAAAPVATISEWWRSVQTRRLRALGRLEAAHAGKVLFVSLLVLATFCVGLKSAQLHSRVEQLWVQEGGRLASEMQYALNALGEPQSSTHQLLVQMIDEAASPSNLQAEALLAHLRVLKAAASVHVHRHDTVWRLHDLCYGPAVPDFDAHFVDQIFDNILPCAIITPLDCFWEGSKLLGPEFPVHIPGVPKRLHWTSLHPMKLLQEMKEYKYNFPFGALESFFKRSGVSTGYMEKPCLDPSDRECPSPTSSPPDVGAALTGGCYGFAAKHMHWPEALVIGGARRNKSRVVRGAKALMSVVQLMAERELFEYWQDTYKVHHVSWTQEMAADVLHDWQVAFAQEVKKIMETDPIAKSHKFYAFSSATLNDILNEFSSLNLNNIVIGFILMLVYVIFCSVRWYDPVMSQVGVGIAGVALLVMSVASGLGFCALLGIPFNASSTQMVPFVSLGLGINDMFSMLGVRWQRNTFISNGGSLLCQAGPIILRSSFSNIISFFAAALIPVPALRVFCLQTAILLIVTLAVIMIVFPAIVSLDERRRSTGRADVVCCIIPQQQESDRVAYQRTVQPDVKKQQHSEVEKELLDDHEDLTCQKPTCRTFALNYLIETYYAPFIMKTYMKVLVILGLVVVMLASLWGAMKVVDGLDLMDIVPIDSAEHKFLDIQGKYFGFYNMYAVTQGDFEYPTNQKLLYEYHDAFVKITHIVKNDDGGLPDFWLSLFRDWLISLQQAFDKDYAAGCINQETWFTNASDDAILAYKLMVQTGHVDNPIDKSLIAQVRLVDSEGIINPKAFYNYLSAWTSIDVFAYSASQGNLRPEPKRWYHSPKDFELKIPKSAPLIYAQIPFYLSGLSDTAQIKTLISSVRSICERFEAKGLTNFPYGIPFLFWEQYMYLRQTLAVAMAFAFAGVFVVLLITTCNYCVSLLVVVVLASGVLRLLGLMALLNVKLSAASAVLLVASVGLGVHYISSICVEFVAPVEEGASPKRAARAKRALMVAGGMTVRGAAAALLATAALQVSPFAFAVQLARLVVAFAVGSLLDGLALVPVLLALAGPPAERARPPMPRRSRRAAPLPSSDVSSEGRGVAVELPPTPTPSPPRRPASLTTITEESPSWRSSQASRSARSSLQSIVVQPELVVETTTTTTPSPSPGEGGTRPPTAVTTKVTATANIKVELHSSDSDRRRRRRERDRPYRDERDGASPRYREGRDSGHESDTSRRS